jgi:hypothetical protein
LVVNQVGTTVMSGAPGEYDTALKRELEKKKGKLEAIQHRNETQNAHLAALSALLNGINRQASSGTPGNFVLLFATSCRA